MAKAPSTPTRVASDIAATATAVASAENRSVAEQVNHWARIGMLVDRSGSVGNRRLLAVVSGQDQFSSLGRDERVAAHALVDARIAELAAAQSFGASARADGQTTVSVDDEGTLTEIAPDGSRRPL
ncbi:MAG: hypothetical protein WD010_07145 [Nitriliruptor sp.]|uniref:TA system antitoxin ParD family protein n=1 Tax=Nitriliruptor sp. TaxID=2448056 RepID=UPI00349FFAEF